MAKQISYKIIPLCLGVLAVSCLLGYVVLAWTEPSVGPPGGNVSAPINMGTNYQAKDGDLGLRTFYTDDINVGGAIPDLYSAHGNLIVKNSSNKVTLEIDGSTGNITMSGDLNVSKGIILGGVKKTTWPSAGIGSCADCDSRFVNVGGEEKVITVRGTNPTCPSGYEAVLLHENASCTWNYSGSYGRICSCSCSVTGWITPLGWKGSCSCSCRACRPSDGSCQRGLVSGSCTLTDWDKAVCAKF